MRAWRRYQTEVHQNRRLKEDINQHANEQGGIPHYIDQCPIEMYPEWMYEGKDWTPPQISRMYIGYPKLTVCGDNYNINPLCPCLYSKDFQYRFKEQPQGKLSTRLAGHGWKRDDIKEEISKLKLEEGIDEYYESEGL